MFAGQAALGVRVITGAWRQVSLVVLFSGYSSSLFAQVSRPASAEIQTKFSENILSSPLWLVLGVAAILAIVSMTYMIRSFRLRRKITAKDISLANLETKLTHAEALISAEPHLLIVWQGKDDQPVQIANGLQDILGVPSSPQEQYNFASWLTPAGVKKLQKNVRQLREQGVPFNVVVTSKSEAMIEAIGRATGRLVTLSLRHLTGERLALAKIAEDFNGLQQKLDTMTAVLDGAPMPVWTKDSEGHLDWVNKAYVAAVDGDGLEDIIDRQVELIEGLRTLAVRPDETDASTKPNIVHSVIAGERRTLNAISIPLGEDNGDAGFALDVTELDQVKGELDQHITAHARTLDQITTAVAIFGPNKNLQFFNTAYAKLWKLDIAWLEQRPSDSEILDALRDARRLPEQANYKTWKNKRLDLYTRAEPQEDWWYLPDGQTIRVVAEQHPFGGLTYLYDNVTEKLSLESRYNALNNVQRETLDNLHEGVALFGSDGRLKLYNPAYEKIWNLQTHPLVDGPHIDDVIKWCRAILPDDDIWADLKYAVTHLPGESSELNRRLNRPDDKVIDFASVHLPDGATLLTYVDITDTANVERALREHADALETADRLKTAFISHISRELRTPLTNIKGFSDSLALGIAGTLNEKQEEYVGYVLKESTALQAIIDDILDLTVIEAGAMELDLDTVEIAPLIEAAANLVQDQVIERRLTLSTRIDARADYFVADVKRVKQILYNLLLNAIGFSSPGGVIELSCSLDGDEICFEISDNGKGIDPEHQSTVFDRFEAKSSGSNHRGAGLGLTIVKSFVELHGGQISLASAPGEGTIVTCRFPKNAVKQDAPQSELKSA